jgi:hypothetical protein
VTALAIPDNQNKELEHEQDESSSNRSHAGYRDHRDDRKPVGDHAELANVSSRAVPVLRDMRTGNGPTAKEIAHEKAKDSKSVSPRPGSRDVDCDCGTTANRVVEPKAGTVNPVPRLSLVNPVPRGSTKARVSGSTAKAHPVPRNGKPPTFTGYKWKPSGLTGWELYTRKPSISINGKRSSTGKYLGYYSQEAVRILYAATQKTANARRA